MQPDPGNLLERIGLKRPLIGFYDAPDVSPFEPLVEPVPGKGTCIFAFYEHWLKGKTLHVTKENFGCRGAGSCLLGLDTRRREDLITFLLDDEGLKRSREIMHQWVGRRNAYRPDFTNVFIGPLRPDQYEYLKTVTFYVNPDQLSALVIGAHYNSGGDAPSPVIAPFGSGCSQMLPLFEDLSVPQAMIGATDIAMRQHLPPDTLGFTVTRPMFRQLCELDERSFLYKPFWRDLRRARERV